VSPDPERGLAAVGRRYAEAALDPTMTAWWRAICLESAHTPELREVFLSDQGGPVQQALGAYLADQTRAGRLTIADPALAAGQFLELCRGALHRRALAGDRERITAAEIDAQVRAAVHLFLHGYSNPGSEPT
jgi:hypothetical protein